MRVLVAALRVDGGATSEGACTAKVVRLLADRGHDVHVLTSQALVEGAVAVLPDAVEVTGVAEAGSFPAAVRRLVAQAPGRYRPDVGLQVATGFDLDERARRRAWARAIDATAAPWQPEVIWVRGAGLDLSPLLAMADIATDRVEGPAWMAHLHDPWPSSWYPPSYRVRSTAIGARQEAALRRVLVRAPVVTAPSARLLAWIEAHSTIAVGDRGHVVAHLGGPLGAAPTTVEHPTSHLPDRPLVVAHVGTLLGPRSPRSLLEALRRAHEVEPVCASDLGLALLGPVDRRHREDPDLVALLARFEQAGAVRSTDTRVAHDEAMAVLGAADAALVLEAPDEESPFFPAKLADALALGVPVVAASPARSVVDDLLGPSVLRAAPDDPAGLAVALTTLWRTWKDGRLAELVPPEGVRARVAPAAVGEAVDAALAAAVSRAGRAGGGGGGRSVKG